MSLSLNLPRPPDRREGVLSEGISAVYIPLPPVWSLAARKGDRDKTMMMRASSRRPPDSPKDRR